VPLLFKIYRSQNLQLFLFAYTQPRTRFHSSKKNSEIMQEGPMLLSMQEAAEFQTRNDDATGRYS
jgi:hypothetical protein